MKKSFDASAFKEAFEAVQVDRILSFYADDLEHQEIDADSPPSSPRTSGKDGLRAALEGITQAGIKLRLDNVVVGDGNAACTITCDLPGGAQLVSNTIYELDKGKIVRQLDVQVAG